MDSQTDSSLMHLVQQGETAQLALLFERHHLSLFRYLLGLTRNRALSEDLVQEVFFRVLKYAHSFDREKSFPVWLYSMGRNAYYDSQHKIRGEAAIDPLAEIKSSAPMPEETMSRQQDVQLLQKALLLLPEDKREVLVLSRFHDLRYDDIARILECEVGAVKVRVYRALKELRARFGELRGEKVYEA